MDAQRSSAEAAACRELGEVVGTANAVVEGLILGVEAAVALGDLEAASDLHSQTQEFADARGNVRMRFMAAVVGVQPALRGGDAALADAELALVKGAQDDFGTPERVDALVATAAATRDRGSWQSSLSTLQAAEEAALQAGFSLLALVIRARQLATMVSLGIDAPSGAAEHLDAECREAGAPFVASYVEAVAAEVAALRGDELPPEQSATSMTLEARAVRADAAALLADRNGGDAQKAWQHAASVWEQLGYTVWLARAQARSDDEAAAQKTLDLIAASDEGRAWALQR